MQICSGHKPSFPSCICSPDLVGSSTIVLQQSGQKKQNEVAAGIQLKQILRIAYLTRNIRSHFFPVI